MNGRLYRFWFPLRKLKLLGLRPCNMSGSRLSRTNLARAILKLIRSLILQLSWGGRAMAHSSSILRFCVWFFLPDGNDRCFLITCRAFSLHSEDGVSILRAWIPLRIYPGACRRLWVNHAKVRRASRVPWRNQAFMSWSCKRPSRVQRRMICLKW